MAAEVTAAAATAAARVVVMAAAMVVVAMAAAAMAAVTVEEAKVVATAADRTPRPHSSARRADICSENTGTPRCRHPLPTSGGPLLASAAFPLPVGRAEAALVVAGRVAATVEARAA
eukprot:scaffold90139_cov30-Phaeocystis_antarctica.AAC.1